jgi:hypothetical protein
MGPNKCVCLILYDLENSKMSWLSAELDCCIAERILFMQESLQIQSAGQCYYFMAEGLPTVTN